MAKTFSDKNMQLWSEVEVKEWVNTLSKFNAKQKKTINAGIDECGLDGDILYSCQSNEELTDALDVAPLLAKRLYKAITKYKDDLSTNGNNNDNNDNNDANDEQKVNN
mmetsp:Transcript_98657/g.120796  ORF Transcript_98657/g.120796 Transcript_98657/m.120796 type:complete len:108 (-) Transcript_98657:17-340(-)